ncbi:MAG: hypothetical protein COB29_13980 [Sulfitobacter sp.]|nr:MAG: hypothetical protein COB29_13980 [Sulfitobacter sp.]
MTNTYTFTISDEDLAALHHVILDTEEWLTNLLQNKIIACREKLVTDGVDTLKADDTVESIPASDSGIIQMIIARSDYKIRKEQLVSAS